MYSIHTLVDMLLHMHWMWCRIREKRQTRIAFGSEIYIIHWDYLTVEYDDVTTSRVPIRILNQAFSFCSLALSPCIFLYYTQMPLTQTYVYRNTREQRQAHISFSILQHAMICSVIIYCESIRSWYLHVSPSYRAASGLCMLTLLFGHVRDKLFIYLFCKTVHTIQMRLTKGSLLAKQPTNTHTHARDKMNNMHIFGKSLPKSGAHTWNHWQTETFILPVHWWSTGCCFNQITSPNSMTIA